MTNAAGLLNTPNDERSWDLWAFQLDQNIRDITDALLKQKNIRVPLYPIYPLPWPAMDDWLEKVGQAMIAITSNTGAPSYDIEEVNLKDDRARQAWAWTIFTEIQAARSNLGI